MRYTICEVTRTLYDYDRKISGDTWECWNIIQDTGIIVIIYLCRRYKVSQRRQKAVEVGGRQKKGERKENILWIVEL